MNLLLTWPLLMALSQAPDVGGASDATDDAKRAEETTRLARDEAARYEIVLGEDRDLPLELNKTPILKWSNPHAGALFGSVFLWTSRGRPQAVASIYRWYTPKQEFHAEFKSLATVPLIATRESETAWDARPSDITFRPFEDLPPPAESLAGRLRQMRDLARRFSAQAINPEDGPQDLRLLTQPVYRYPEGLEDVVDGAMFAFGQGTDPDVFLILEAERSDGSTRWRWAASRMNMFELHLTFDGREIWTVDELPWQDVISGRGPYAIIMLAY